MLFLQIILVPVFVLILVGSVFLIGVGATIPTRDDTPNNLPLYHDGKYSPPNRMLPPS